MGCNLKDFLSSNKIYFETVASTFIAIAAVYVSFATYRVTQDQLRISEIQTKISDAQISPQFIVTSSGKVNDKTGQILNDEITITNKGGLAYSFSTSSAIILDLAEIDTGSVSIRSVKKYLKNYYTLQILSQEGDGEMARILGFNSSWDLYQYNLNLLYGNGRSKYKFSEIQRFVRISYTDALDRKHIKYFLVNPITGSRPVNESEGMRVFGNQAAAYADGSIIDFDSLRKEIKISNNFVPR